MVRKTNDIWNIWDNLWNYYNPPKKRGRPRKNQDTIYDGFLNISSNFWDTPKPRRRKKFPQKQNYRKKSYTRTSYKTKKEEDIIKSIIIITFIFFVFILPKLSTWEIISLLTIFWLCLISFIFYKYDRYQKKKIAEKERIERIPIFIKELHKKISWYVPLRYHSREEPYQMELAWFLRSHYENTVIEDYKNHSRPDIVIEKTAIEIKWPTTRKELCTIPDKIIRYLKDWETLFIVLFNVQIYEDEEKNKEAFENWKKDIYETFSANKDRIYIINL